MVYHLNFGVCVLTTDFDDKPKNSNLLNTTNTLELISCFLFTEKETRNKNLICSRIINCLKEITGRYFGMVVSVGIESQNLTLSKNPYVEGIITGICSTLWQDSLIYSVLISKLKVCGFYGVPKHNYPKEKNARKKMVFSITDNLF